MEIGMWQAEEVVGEKDGKTNGEIMMAQTRWAQFFLRRGALTAASTVTWRGNAQRKVKGGWQGDKGGGKNGGGKGWQGRLAGNGAAAAWQIGNGDGGKGGMKGGDWNTKGVDYKGGKKGGGKGYQGQCCRCNQTGHKSWECGVLEVGGILDVENES